MTRNESVACFLIGNGPRIDCQRDRFVGIILPCEGSSEMHWNYKSHIYCIFSKISPHLHHFPHHYTTLLAFGPHRACSQKLLDIDIDASTPRLRIFFQPRSAGSGASKRQRGFGSLGYPMASMENPRTEWRCIAGNINYGACSIATFDRRVTGTF